MSLLTHVSVAVEAECGEEPLVLLPWSRRFVTTTRPESGSVIVFSALSVFTMTLRAE